MAEGRPVPDSVYFYAPNHGAAIFFAAAFATSGLLHLWQCYYYKYFRVTALLPFCCALWTAAFATRAYGSFHYDDAQVYTASRLLIYIAPPLLQLANYLILCRAFHFVPYFAPMHPGRMFITFASLAAVAELLAIAGVAYLSNHALPDKSMEVGVTLAKTSLATQIIIVALLFPLAGTFHHCCRAGKIRSPKVMRPLLLLYANMVLLLGRTVYYMVEHFGFPPQNEDRDPMSLSPTVRHEWYFLVFDATFMLICSVLWNIWHPRHFLPEAREMYLAQDGVTVLKGPGWKDSRSLTETFFNPFAMLTTHGGHQKQFWEHNGFTLKTRRKKPAGRV